VTSNHGYGPYSRGCRCEICRAAKREYIKARRSEAARRRDLSDLGAYVAVGITHGIAGYGESKCRCDVCMDVMRNVKRRQYHARKEAVA